jgi:hypothetical protein
MLHPSMIVEDGALRGRPSAGEAALHDVWSGNGRNARAVSPR